MGGRAASRDCASSTPVASDVVSLTGRCYGFGGGSASHHGKAAGGSTTARRRSHVGRGSGRPRGWLPRWGRKRCGRVVDAGPVGTPNPPRSSVPGARAAGPSSAPPQILQPVRLTREQKCVVSYRRGRSSDVPRHRELVGPGPYAVNALIGGLRSPRSLRGHPTRQHLGPGPAGTGLDRDAVLRALARQESSAAFGLALFHKPVPPLGPDGFWIHRPVHARLAVR